MMDVRCTVADYATVIGETNEIGTASNGGKDIQNRVRSRKRGRSVGK